MGNGSNEWSLSDYKRRISSTATVEASYEARPSHRPSPSPSSLGQSLTQVSTSDDLINGSDILGLAAGGQMYDVRDLTAYHFIDFLNRAQKIYRNSDSPRVQLGVLL